MRKQNINKPRACEIKIWVALAMLLRVGITIYKVMSLTIDQLQLSNNPSKINVHVLLSFINRK